MNDKAIPMNEWGKDHWSTLAYLETCVVDQNGYLDARRMRTSDPQYPTRLYGYATDETRKVDNHSDWDCVSDFIVAGLVEPAPGTTAKGRLPFKEFESRANKLGTASARNQSTRFVLTEEGIKVCAALRAHKARGGNFGQFVYSDEGE
ncbi:MAG TPA: hypothetical protein VLO13_03590 [Halomonas sp.]|nr:hypothetical protein [Halomonas sp.]